MFLDMYLYYGLPLRPSPRRAATAASPVREASKERTTATERAVRGARKAERMPQLHVIEGDAADAP